MSASLCLCLCLYMPLDTVFLKVFIPQPVLFSSEYLLKQTNTNWPNPPLFISSPTNSSICVASSFAPLDCRATNNPLVCSSATAYSAAPADSLLTDIVWLGSGLVSCHDHPVNSYRLRIFASKGYIPTVQVPPLKAPFPRTPDPKHLPKTIPEPVNAAVTQTVLTQLYIPAPYPLTRFSLS